MRRNAATVDPIYIFHIPKLLNTYNTVQTSFSNLLLNANLCWEMVQVSVIKRWGTEWERDERLGSESTDKQGVFHPKYYYQ